MVRSKLIVLYSLLINYKISREIFTGMLLSEVSIKQLVWISPSHNGCALQIYLFLTKVPLTMGKLLRPFKSEVQGLSDLQICEHLLILPMLRIPFNLAFGFIIAKTANWNHSMMGSFVFK